MSLDVALPAGLTTDLGEFSVLVESYPVALFAYAIGATDALDSPGGERVPVPPTYLFSLERRSPNLSRPLDELGLDRDRMLHVEQSFDLRAPTYVGDELVLAPRIVECFERSGGALTFIRRETTVSCEGRTRAVLRNLVVIRGEAA
jgi:hypothetical protein